MDIVSVNGLSKTFGDLKAVDNLSFSIQKGNVYGFLGQNGAGKSTTIRMLLTLIKPTAGTIRIFDKDLRQERNTILANIGTIIEKPDLYKYLSARENLEIMCRLSGKKPSRKELDEQLSQVGLLERANSKIKTFSQGMKQRLGIACALIHDPQLIILDEPTNGLDPQGIADMRELIGKLSVERNKTILISSHLLSEIELIADAMLILHKGRKLAEGKVNELLNPKDTLVEVDDGDKNEWIRIVQDSDWQNGLTEVRGRYLMRMHKNQIPAFNRFLVDHDVEVSGLTARHSLEDYFLSLTAQTDAGAY